MLSDIYFVTAIYCSIKIIEFDSVSIVTNLLKEIFFNLTLYISII